MPRFCRHRASRPVDGGRFAGLGVRGIASFGLLAMSVLLACVGHGRRPESARAAPAPRLTAPPIDAPAPEAAAEAAPSPPASTPPTEYLFRVPIGDSPQRGRADALVTIVEFVDFQCPFSKRVQETFDQLERERGDRVRIVFKHNPLPFHSKAMVAAEASFAAEAQGKFWQMKDILFENQTELGPDDLDRYAARIGLDRRRFRHDLHTHAHRARIEADQQLATSLGARGTPTFFMNGRMVRGAQSLDTFLEIVDREADRAQALVARGTSQGLVYEELTRDGRTTPAPRTERPDDDHIYPIVSDPNAPSRGPASAAVTLIAFCDFECPYSAQVAPTLAQLEQAYEGRVRIEFRHHPRPFHEHAQLAHEAAAEAHAQGRFWPYHDLLFAHQDALTRPDLERYAVQAGLDLVRFRAALDDHRHAATIQADVDAPARAGVRIGTPSFFLDGKLRRGAMSLDTIRREIDAALAGR